jgi:hypothetical protein
MEASVTEPVDAVSGVAYYGAVAGFTKLFSTIVDSTVWREEMHVKVVWITMLAKANRNGDVLASVPGLADAARVSLDQCVEALARLSAPDPWSRTKEHEGRRIVEVDGGWRLLNYPKYRELRDADERRIQTREAVRRYRAKQSAEPLTVSNRKPGKPRKAQAEAEAEAEKDTKGRPAPTDWQALVLTIKAELGSMTDTNGSILKAMLRGSDPDTVRDAIRGLGILKRRGEAPQDVDLRFLWAEKARQGLPTFTRCLTAYYESLKDKPKRTEAHGPQHIGAILERRA